VIFVKIGAVEAILYLGAQINLYQCFLYLLSDLCEIPYKRAAYNAGEHLRVSVVGGWVSLRGGLNGCGISRDHQDSIPGPSSTTVYTI
jgi:hypothetical protein